MSACHAPSLAAGAFGPVAGAPPLRYQRRRPERTVLYRLVQQHLESWLADRREVDSDAEPIADFLIAFS